jgi:aminopeptidase-like protein
VPREWNIRDACVTDRHGRRVIDFGEHNLHIVGYSTAVRRTMSLEELQPHLHSLPEHPDWIPYRTSYYKEAWGSCLRHRGRESLHRRPTTCDDTPTSPGHLTTPNAWSRSDWPRPSSTPHLPSSLANDN